jgi:hypothetical protein
MSFDLFSRTLLELGASPNYKDTKGLTPLYLSVMQASDVVLCEMLLHDHSAVGAQDLQGWQEVHQVTGKDLTEREGSPYLGPPRVNVTVFGGIYNLTMLFVKGGLYNCLL